MVVARGFPLQPGISLVREIGGLILPVSDYQIAGWDRIGNSEPASTLG